MAYDVKMNSIITIEELQKAVKKAKCYKAPGFDEIPVYVLKMIGHAFSY